jgi:histone-lysine N-methyltransferase SETMAR
VTIAWNPFGFHFLKALPKGMSINAGYYHDNILTELLPLRPQAYGRQLLLHADNARAHIARKCQAFYTENRLRPAVHPPYSPDLAPSDFFLFGHLKYLLQGAIFASCDQLFAASHEIVAGIPQETLQGVFQHWMERLEWVSQNNGEYYP